MEIRVLIILTCLLLYSCSKPCYHCDLGHNLIFEHAKQMNAENLCFLGGYGGSFFDRQVRELDINLSHIQKVDVTTARVMLVRGVEQFLISVNNDKKIREFLIHYPFTSHDLRYSMDFFSESGQFVSSDFIAYVSLIKGNIYYSIYNQKTKMLEDIAKESYLEAMEKVKRKNEENLLSVANPS